MSNDRKISNIFHFNNINNRNSIILRPCSTTRKRIRRLLNAKRFEDFENIVPNPNPKTTKVAPREQKNKISRRLCIKNMKKFLTYYQQSL